MVFICPYEFTDSDDKNQYEQYFNNYSYLLHDFQKWALKAIVDGDHVLVCAPTGSGKTLPGEFALNYFHSKSKKTIYTSPIKALSNEKFYNFTQKYSHLSVGLITGDIKTNPDADVLIMTTEILLNKLYQIKSKNLENKNNEYNLNEISSEKKRVSIDFEMDIESELGCVVFDEIHMINDESRGHVWEQCIMMLPSHIQMVGLSATLDNPEGFAEWLETRGVKNDDKISNNKTVYLAKKLTRAVPLIHYSFITVTNTLNKHIKDKATQETVRQFINKPLIIQDEKGKFNDLNYNNIKKTLKLFEENEIHVKRPFVLNKVAEYLTENEMLPALCYVFSRKQLEKCAHELQTTILEFDSKVSYTVDRECEQIIRKLPNYEEYLHLPEYIEIVKLLRKGIGIHHAGIMPVLREMVELLFARGFIKMLFCTETMSVGINLPVKTTIFTDIYKFNGDIMRTLYSHEYTQAAGRAGRLGLDSVGHVIHLNNLFRDVETVNYKNMMNGKPQKLVSKFKISYNLLLNLINIGDNNIINFAKRSMNTEHIENQINEIQLLLDKSSVQYDELKNQIQYLKTPSNIIEQYIDLQSKLKTSVNKKRKDIERQIFNINDNHKHIQQDKIKYDSLLIKLNEIKAFKDEINILKGSVNNEVGLILDLLESRGFIEYNNKNNENLSIILTDKGKISVLLREVHCLAFTDLFNIIQLSKLNVTQIVCLLSCFTNISVNEELKSNTINTDDKIIHNAVRQITELYDFYRDKELELQINTGVDYFLHYDLLEYVYEWCDAESIEECKIILNKLNGEKNIFLGEFVKALLKINNVSCELEKIAELTNNIELLSKLREIPNKTLKYIVTNQSLYV